MPCLSPMALSTRSDQTAAFNLQPTCSTRVASSCLSSAAAVMIWNLASFAHAERAVPAAVMIWKFAETDIDNSTGKEWIATTDTTWTQIIEPYAQKISAHAPPVASCMPGALGSSMGANRRQTVEIVHVSEWLLAGRPVHARGVYSCYKDPIQPTCSEASPARS